MGAAAIGRGEPLGLQHRDTVENALEQLRRPWGERALSDLTFQNLYLFRAVHAYCYLTGQHPCISGITYDGTPHLIPLFDLTNTPPGVLTDLLGPHECFYPVSAEVMAGFRAEGFEATVVREDCDYLYRASEFVDYGAHSLRGQRGAVRRLQERCHITQQDVRHDGGSAALQVLDNWLVEKRLDPGAADSVACREAIHPPLQLRPLAGTIYYADGQPAGFLLTETLNPNVQVVRFAKGLKAYDGIYPCMFQQLCRQEAPSLQWLNFEQDLGKANFRKSKLSYAPERLLDKFRVRPRAG